MINHVSVGTNDTRRARAFYEPLLSLIGFRLLKSSDKAVHFGASIEAGPFVDRSTATAAIKVTGALLRLLFLACRIDSRAVRAGEMDDQLQIVRHPPMMDLDSIIFQCGAKSPSAFGVSAPCPGRRAGASAQLRSFLIQMPSVSPSDGGPS